MKTVREEKIGFIKTTLGICSGTEIFSKFISTSPTRSLTHFIIIAFLAATAYVALKSPSVFESAISYCDALDKYFGGVSFSDDGVTPLTSPEASRTVKIRKMKIDYIPSPEMSYKIHDEGAARGLIWLPRTLYFWVKMDSGYQYVPILSSSKSINSTKFSAASLDTILDLTRNDNFTHSSYGVRQSFSFSEAKLAIFLITLGIYFVGMLFNTLISIPIYSLMILAIFSLFGNRILKKVKSANFFSIILYSSFPVIIISTIYVSLSLPFFDFKTLAFSSLIIYSFVVINSLQNKLYPKKQEDENYDDDIF